MKWFSTSWNPTKTTRVTTPAVGEWRVASTTAGTPAISPPTRGIIATRATHRLISRANGTPRITMATRMTRPNMRPMAAVPST